MKILLTGATGLVGSRLVRALRDRGDDVPAREPAQVRRVAVAPFRGPERAAHEKVAHEAEVARVGDGHVQPPAGRGQTAQRDEHALGVDEVLEHVVTDDRVERPGELAGPQALLDGPDDQVVDHLAAELGRRPATVSETRQMIGLPMQA